MSRLEGSILALLNRRMENGVWQSEIESISGYSKSHLSETISSMEERRLVIRRKEGNVLNRVWSTLYFPGIVEGTLRAGILRSSEYMPALDILEDVCAGYGIKLRVRVFSSSVHMLESLHSKSIEIAMAPAVAQIIYASIRGSMHIISSVASGGSAIYENTGSDSHYCSGSEISTMTFMTRKFLEENRSISYLPYTSPEKGIDAFRSGKVKYIAAWEPYCRLLESAENVRKVVGYRELLDGLPCCLMSCTDSTMGIYGQLYRDIKNEYGNFCASGASEMRTIRSRSGIFRGRIASKVQESLKEYTFVSDVDSSTIQKIASENGILVSVEKVESWLSEFISPL